VIVTSLPLRSTFARPIGTVKSGSFGTGKL